MQKSRRTNIEIIPNIVCQNDNNEYKPEGTDDLKED